MSVEAGTLVPELVARDPEAARAWLEGVLGFARKGHFLRLGDQRLIVSEGEAGAPGAVDHLALAVPDLDAGLAGARARGARLGATTPEGPLAIPEFWGRGVRYAFLDGPEGAPVELIAPEDPALRRGPGHDHLGVACGALRPMRAFFESLGGLEVASHVLRRPGGDVEVCFLRLGGSLAELYTVPGARAGGPGGPWRLRMAGLAEARRGPEGVEVRPL